MKESGEIEDVRILALDAHDVARACTMSECVEEMARVFALQAKGKVESPLRARLAAPSGDILVMPSIARRARAEGSVKVVSVFPKNKKRTPSVNAVVLLVDGETGEPKAVISGGILTSIRTGAVTGLSCRYLARKDSETVAIVGAGGQAFQQVNGVLTALGSIKRVKIFSLETGRSRALARQCSKAWNVEARVFDDIDKCIEGSDVIVTATTSKTPVFDGSRVEPGTHVVAMGAYRPETRELDSALVSRASIFVDSREAVLEEAGDLLIPIKEGLITKNSIRAELSELVSGKRKGRSSRSEITIFKCVGLAFEDNAAGWLAYRRARELGVGKWIGL